MILTIEDDGCLHLYDSLDAVVLNTESLDAEECLRAVFDEWGQRYAIEWIEPNKRGRIGATNGRYRLVASGEPDWGGLKAAIDEAGPRGLSEREWVLVEAVRDRR
jgi:hypothetical protein